MQKMRSIRIFITLSKINSVTFVQKISDEIERKTTQLFPQKYLLKFRKGQPLIFGSAYLTSTQNILWERNEQKKK